MSPPALVRRTDKDCSKKDNKDSQLCATGESTSAWEVCLAVILPVFFIGVILGYFVWRAYKKNKKEALEDDDPDFNGDNIVLPDIIEDKDSDQGRYRTPGANPFKYANSSSVQLPQKAATNPFGDSKAYEAGHDMNQKVPPSYMYNHAENMSQTSFPRTLHNHDPVESIVLPYAEETVSKRSLEELSRQLGGDYGGYRVPERKLESESASVMQSIASRSNVSGNSGKSADLGADGLNVGLAKRSEAGRGNRGEMEGRRSEGDGKDGGKEGGEDRNAGDTDEGDGKDGIDANTEDRGDRIDGNLGNREDGNKENTSHSKTTSSAQRTTYSISIPARATARGLGNVPPALESAEQDPGSRNDPPAAYGDPRQAHSTARTMLMRGNVQKSQSSAQEGTDSAHFGYPDGTVATTADTYTSSSGEYSPDKYHSSDIGSSDVDRTNTMQSMSQMTYQTPNESVESSPDVPDAGKRVPYVSVEQEGYTNCEESRKTSGKHAGEDIRTPEDDTLAPAGKTARVRSQIGRKQLIGGKETGSEAGENAENAEEEEQIDRMKSVYKVYFSRDSSIMSRNSRSEYKFDATGADVPPLPEIAFPNKGDEESDGEYVNLDSKRNVKGDINEGINGETEGEKYGKDDQKYQKYDQQSVGKYDQQYDDKYDQQSDDKSNQNLSTINETTSNPPQRPALTVDTNPENRMSTASYSSSVYVPATTQTQTRGTIHISKCST